MDTLERYQVLLEVVIEFRTALYNEEHTDRVGRLVLDVVRESGDLILYDKVQTAYYKIKHKDEAIAAVEDAVTYLSRRIDEQNA